MADSTAQFVNQAQEANRSFFNAIQGAAQTPFGTLQRIAEIQRDVFKQSLEAANDQLQLVTRVRDPREFASAQADLVKSHGQRYLDTIKEVVDVMADAWQEYGDRLERGMDATADKTRGGVSSRKAA